MQDDLVTLLSELKKDEALRVASERLASGEDPMLLLKDGQEAMRIVGDRFARGTYFIPDLIYSGKILEQISEMVKPSGDVLI